MNIKNIRWPVVIVTFALCLSVFWGIHHLRQKQFIEEPLLQALEGLEEVEGVELRSKSGSLEIRIRAPRLEDFPDFHQRLEGIVTGLYRGDYILILEDAPDPEIRAAYQKVHLALFEAMAQGNYVSMGDYVARVGAEHGLDTCRVAVTEGHIYLEMKNGEAYLYRRFVREPVKGEEA